MHDESRAGQWIDFFSFWGHNEIAYKGVGGRLSTVIKFSFLSPFTILPSSFLLSFFLLISPEQREKIPNSLLVQSLQNFCRGSLGSYTDQSQCIRFQWKNIVIHFHSHVFQYKSPNVITVTISMNFTLNVRVMKRKEKWYQGKKKRKPVSQMNPVSYSAFLDWGWPNKGDDHDLEGK